MTKKKKVWALTQDQLDQLPGEVRSAMTVIRPEGPRPAPAGPSAGPAGKAPPEYKRISAAEMRDLGGGR